MKLLIASVLIFISQSCLAAGSIFLLPGEKWGFEFNSPKLTYHKGNATESEYQLEASTDVGFIISAFVEPAQGKGKSPEKCMKYYWSLSSRNASIQKDTVKVASIEPFAVVSYLIDAEYQGKRYIQPNANYYGFRDNKCIDVHVSQVFPHEAKIDYSNLIEFARSFGYFK